MAWTPTVMGWAASEGERVMSFRAGLLIGGLSMAVVALAVVVLVLALGGSDGGETVSTVANEGEPASVQTYLPKIGYEGNEVEPRLYGFSVDGSLFAKQLIWTGWGASKATGRGKIGERNWSSGDPTDIIAYPGSVVASRPEDCNGKRYYTRVVALVPENAVYVPDRPTELTTPCRSYGSIPAETPPSPESQALLKCGNPPGWSGDLVASGVTCGEADLIFERIHCLDSACTERRSEGWVCDAHPETKFRGGGECRKLEQFIRWHVYE